MGLKWHFHFSSNSYYLYAFTIITLPFIFEHFFCCVLLLYLQSKNDTFWYCLFCFGLVWFAATQIKKKSLQWISLRRLWKVRNILETLKCFLFKLRDVSSTREFMQAYLSRIILLSVCSIFLFLCTFAFYFRLFVERWENFLISAKETRFYYVFPCQKVPATLE